MKSVITEWAFDFPFFHAKDRGGAHGERTQHVGTARGVLALPVEEAAAAAMSAFF